MSVIEQKAEAIAADMSVTQTAAVPPIPEPVPDPKPVTPIAAAVTITTIISIIQSLIQAFQQCGQTVTQATASMNNPGLLQRWRLRGIILRHVVGNGPTVGESQRQLFHSTLKVASTVSEPDTQSMYDEVQ